MKIKLYNVKLLTVQNIVKYRHTCMYVLIWDHFKLRRFCGSTASLGQILMVNLNQMTMKLVER